MKRWAWLVRRGISSGHGFPAQSAHCDRIAGKECYDIDMTQLTNEEKGTIAAMELMNKTLNLIARLKWSYGYSHAKIANKIGKEEYKINHSVKIIKKGVVDAVIL